MASAFDQEIIRLEQDTWEVLKKSGGALIPFLSKDCIMIFPGGKIFSQTSTPTLNEIALRADMKPWSSYKMTDVHVLNVGKDAASISYSVHASRPDSEYEALITSIWRRDDNGEWKMILHQQTPS